MKTAIPMAHIALTCYNGSEKELFLYEMVNSDRLTRARLMSL